MTLSQISSIFIATFFLFVYKDVSAQLNLSGKPGLLYTPTARETQDGELHIAYSLNPAKYNIKNYGGFSENVFAFNLTILSRLDVNLNLLKPNGNIPYKHRGIGDRQIEFKYQILKQRKNQPGLALFVAAPFSTDVGVITNALVATKDFKVGHQLELETTVGYASPWYFFRDVNALETNGIFDAITLGDKRDQPFPHLSGPIAGAKLTWKKKFGVMAEWDSQRVNAGAYATLFKCWTLQAGLLNLNTLTFGTSFRTQLKKTKRKD
jgi:hypothetical protein